MTSVAIQRNRKSKWKGGRPSTFQPQFCDLARNYALLGCDNQRIADLIGVPLATLATWMRTQPEFSAAIKEGRDGADVLVAKSLYHRAKGYSHKAVKIFCDPKTGAKEVIEYTEHYPPDTVAAIFWLKNRHPERWRDVSRTEITGANGGPVEIDRTDRDTLMVEARKRGLKVVTRN